MISAIVLAAGTSTRMGRPKPLVRLGGEPLLARTLAAVRRSRVREIVVVLGHEAERVRREVPLDGVKVVENREYEAGMGTSIRAGIRAASPKAKAFLIMLGDQPLLSEATLDALLDQRAATGARIVIPTFRGRRGNPVLVDRSLESEVVNLPGDVGCRAIFPRHADDILEIPVDDPGILIDLDTDAQLERVERALSQHESLEAIVADLGASASLHEPNPHETLVAPEPDLFAVVHELRSRDEPFALATVVRAVRPTSGKPGYKAIVRANRQVVGWVGGSCAEPAVVAESLAALRDGRPRLIRLMRVPGLAPAEEGVVEYVMECHSGGAMDIYIEPHLPKPRLLIVGDSPVATTLAALGRLMEYRVVAVAPGASADTFRGAAEVVADLDRLAELATPGTYAVVATMGKYDETALASLAPSPARYVGLVASQRRAAVVLETLRREGVAAESLDRIRNPAGLDLAAATPAEIALSIMAEITRTRRTAGEESPAVEAREAHAIDVVCGMTVDPHTPLRAEHEGTTYYFCSEGCRTRFLESPATFLA